MSDTARPEITLDAAVDALSDARGCGCCGTCSRLAALAPCSPRCERDEDGDVLHTYGDGCSEVFSDGARRLLEALVAQARREVAAELAGRMMGAEARLRGMAADSAYRDTRIRLGGKREGVSVALSYVEEVLREAV